MNNFRKKCKIISWPIIYQKLLPLYVDVANFSISCYDRRCNFFSNWNWGTILGEILDDCFYLIFYYFLCERLNNSSWIKYNSFLSVSSKLIKWVEFRNLWENISRIWSHNLVNGFCRSKKNPSQHIIFYFFGIECSWWLQTIFLYL